MLDPCEIWSAVKLYLQANGYGGLCRPDRNDSCGCGIDDLMPCGDRYAVWDYAAEATWAEAGERQVEIVREIVREVGVGAD